MRTAPAVDDHEIRTLVEIGRRVEQHYGCPQDIEWAISASAMPGENIFLLQSRPVTVGQDRDRVSLAAPKDTRQNNLGFLL
jgi:pyruvate,water dikinase